MELYLICPICKSNSIQKICEQNNVPVHQNVILDGEEKAKKIGRGDILLGICKNCGFISQHSLGILGMLE